MAVCDVKVGNSKVFLKNWTKSNYKYLTGFIKTTDHRPTDHLPLTHRPTDQLHTEPPTIIKIVEIEDEILNLFCGL